MTDRPPTPGLQEIDAATLARWRSSGEAVLVDVRETHEYEYEHIPGALLMPLSFLDPDVFPRITEKRLVLVCEVGKRSAAAGKQLLKSGLDNVVNLIGGLDAWKKAGYETEGARFETDDYVI